MPSELRSFARSLISGLIDGAATLMLWLMTHVVGSISNRHISSINCPLINYHKYYYMITFIICFIYYLQKKLIGICLIIPGP